MFHSQRNPNLLLFTIFHSNLIITIIINLLVLLGTASSSKEVDRKFCRGLNVVGHHIHSHGKAPMIFGITVHMGPWSQRFPSYIHSHHQLRTSYPKKQTQHVWLPGSPLNPSTSNISTHLSLNIYFELFRNTGSFNSFI